jgi:hypothetical protein
MLLVASWAQLPGNSGAQPFKVAFIGDTGYDRHDTPALDAGFEKVLDLMRRTSRPSMAKRSIRFTLPKTSMSRRDKEMYKLSLIGIDWAWFA